MRLMLVLFTLPLALLLWYFTFAVEAGIFWYKLAPSAAILAFIALIISRRDIANLFLFRWRHLWVGLFSALVLYGIFWIGKELSQLLFPLLIPGFDPSGQLLAVYKNKSQLEPVLIGLLLLLVMGPAEEIYWRGFVQRVLGERVRLWCRILYATSAYALVHVVALNFMLVMAAAVCGLFWGWLYEREKSLMPVIISHSLWDLSVFILFPLI